MLVRYVLQVATEQTAVFAFIVPVLDAFFFPGSEHAHVFTRNILSRNLHTHTFMTIRMLYRIDGTTFDN